MGWYYYMGSTIRPIPVAKGRSVAVRPHSKFEVFEEMQEHQDLASRGVIRKTGGPKSPKPKGAVPKIIKKDIPLGTFAQSIAEKGVTSSKNVPPVSKGPVEMTVDEAHSIVEDAEEDEKKKGKGKGKK